MKINETKMKKTFAVILVFCIAFLLTSCGKSDDRRDVNYKQGTPDVELDFFGSEMIFEDREFRIPVMLYNKLGYDIQDVEVTLVGLDGAYVDVFNSKEVFNLIEGRSIFNGDGGQERVEYSGFGKKLPIGADSNPLTYEIFVDYDSKVEFSSTICVSPSPYQGVGDGGCTVQRNLHYSGQGAPLAITEMESVPGEITELRMKVAERGDGNVGTIILGTATLGGKPLNCEFKGSKGNNPKQGVFWPKEREIWLICGRSITGAASYETPVFVELLYDYQIRFKNKLVLTR